MKKILILEDEEILAILYKTALGKKGYKVITACNTTEAKKNLKSLKPDIIFADHILKGEEETGMDFLKFAKKQLPEATMIMLTNNRNIELEEKAKKLGVKDFLIKINISTEFLAQYIEKL